MLGIKEKITLQRAVQEGIKSLKAGIKDIRERIATQRRVKEALPEELKEVSDPGDAKVSVKSTS